MFLVKVLAWYDDYDAQYIVKYWLSTDFFIDCYQMVSYLIIFYFLRIYIQINSSIAHLKLIS